MDKERFRIPSDSSSGSRASPNLSPNSSPNGYPSVPPGFESIPTLSQSQPGIGSGYRFTQRYDNMNYTLGMPSFPRCPSQLPVGFVSLPNCQHHVNGFPVQASLVETSSPPPGYNNYFGNIHQPTTLQTCSPFNSRHSMVSNTRSGEHSPESGGVMKPIIENLVSSMSMSNGSYSHFGGPSVPSIDSRFQNGQSEFYAPCISAISPITTQSMQVDDMEQSHLPSRLNSSSPATNGIPTELIVPPERTLTVSQNRASSPREVVSEGSPSRPQTPGKPSYLEVLTKTGPKSHPFCDSAPNLSHRKSVDYFVGPASSTTSSSSASSSPATKPRNVKSAMGLVSSPSPTKVNSSTPHKENVSPPPTKGNVSTTPIKLNTKQKTLSKSGNTVNGVYAACSVNPGEVIGDASTEKDTWKTYTTRGRNNNLSTVGNKNPQKRVSNGLVSSISNSEPSISSIQSFEKKAMPASPSNSSSFTHTTSHGKRNLSQRTEKTKSKKEYIPDRNCVTRRLEVLAYTWLAHMISALSWLWSLITDVASLSASLGVSIMQDLYIWSKTKALPLFTNKIFRWRKATCDCWHHWTTKLKSCFGSTKKEDPDPKPTPRHHNENILSLLGPERNISLPANGDEALKRLLSVKGQDPYSILGVRSDGSEETIRRYYKRQAVLVHPDKNLIVGAEEAFKILARAFEMVGDPIKRAEYHQKLMEAQAKEKFCGEIGNLLEQLRKKMEAASSTIRCTKCNSRHKKNITDRPLFAARYCSQCRIHHGAREGELWAERGGWFGISWNYFACMDSHVWEINEWARCQKANLKHIKADAHCVMYRLVAGGNNQQNQNQHCHANGTHFDGEDRFGAGSEADEWDSLINNLCRSPPHGGANGNNRSSSTMNGNSSNNAGNQAAGRRKKGNKRSK